ncbi:MAG: hypothetical protein KDA61_16615 [Planctomycetales bacterium]|nr:hypothetical protein [Planctomycetales bacterium]
MKPWFFRPTAGRRLIALALGVMLSAPAYFSVAQSPVAHWTFDVGLNNYATTTVEDVANDNDGVWQDMDGEAFDLSGLSYAAGRIGGAVKLGGGTDQFFLVDAIPQLDGIVPTPVIGAGDPVLGVGLTLSAWIYAPSTAATGYKGLLKSRSITDETSGGTGTGQDWGLAWEGGDHIDARLSGQALDSSAVITRDAWHHVAMVWGNVDATASFIPPAFRVYVDGTLEAEDADSEVYELVSGGAWLIGEDSCCGGREFGGMLDDLAVFDSALSTAEVQTLYNNGLNGINASGVATAPILPGDADGDGDVSIDDFEIIRSNLTKTVTARNLGDLDGNRRVDLDDFQQWLDVAPASLAAQAMAALSSAAVPEPVSGTLAAVGVAAALRRRRRLGCR